MKSFRLNDASSISAARQFTNTCSMCGKVFSAIVPQAWGFTGTMRQPATSRPCRSRFSFTAVRAEAARIGSRLRKMSPDANFSASSMPASAATARRKASGFFSSKPQPSPVLPSAAIAPRWVNRFNDVMAVRTSQ